MKVKETRDILYSGKGKQLFLIIYKRNELTDIIKRNFFILKLKLLYSELYIYI